MSDDEHDRDLGYFRSSIEAFAEEAGWSVAFVEERQAAMGFSDQEGVSLTCMITQYPAVVEFAVALPVSYGPDEEMPLALCQQLLEQNAELALGFWALKRQGGRAIPVVLCNVPLEGLDSGSFSDVVHMLLGTAGKRLHALRDEQLITGSDALVLHKPGSV